MLRVFQVSLMVWTGLMVWGIQAFSSGFDPSGEWSVELSKDALARSFYHEKDLAPFVGSAFSVMTYFGQDPKDREFLSRLEKVKEITVSYDSDKNEVVLTGGAPGSRVLVEDRTVAVGEAHRVYISSTPLQNQVKMVAPGCLEYSGMGERISFLNSDSLEFYDRTVFVRFEAPSGNFDDCSSYLKHIRAEIRNGIAPSFWMAGHQTHGLDEGQMEDLIEMDIHFFY
jgi:hypothetical protein